MDYYLDISDFAVGDRNPADAGRIVQNLRRSHHKVNAIARHEVFLAERRRPARDDRHRIRIVGLREPCARGRLRGHCRHHPVVACG